MSVRQTVIDHYIANAQDFDIKLPVGSATARLSFDVHGLKVEGGRAEFTVSAEEAEALSLLLAEAARVIKLGSPA